MGQFTTVDPVDRARGWRASGPEAARILALGKPRRFAPRQTIFSCGDPGDFMALIERGTVRVGLVGEDGRELALRLMGPGEVLGEIAALDGGARTADAVAVDAVDLRVITARDVAELVRRDAAVALWLIRLLCARLRATTGALEGMALASLPKRLAQVLIDLARPEPDGALSLRLPSQSDLARLVGASRESVNRQLRAWSLSGAFATRDDGMIVIRDPASLDV